MSKKLDTLTKLLTQAERAEEGSPEREAFMERAMALSATHGIDLAIARAHQARKERVEQPEKRSFKVGQDRLHKQKNAHFVDLMLAVCDANDVQCLISGNNMYVHGTGMPSDLDMCERFFSILAPQMVEEADAGLKRGDNGVWEDDAPKMRREPIPEDERDWGGRKPWVDHWGPSAYYDERDEEIREIGGKPHRLRYNEVTGYEEWVESRQPPAHRNVPVLDGDGNPVLERKWRSTSDGRAWRTNFYKGFVLSVGQRLRDAKRQALLDAGIRPEDDGDSRAVALRDKEKEVKDAFEEQNRYVLFNADGTRKKGRYGGAGYSGATYGGTEHGRRAGREAVIGTERDLR
jgi:hypothetical protein